MRLKAPLSTAAACLIAAAVFSSPLAAQWPAGKGKYWTKLSVFHHRTTEQFRSSGEKRPFLAGNAIARSSAIFIDALVGVTDRADLWLQVPYFDLNFDDDVDERHSSGVGDVRLSARYNLFGLRSGSVQVAARFTTKIPVVDFPIDAEVIPVGEGQWDHEAWLEVGASFWPIPAYGVVWFGRRWRQINTKTTRDPGDEFALLAELGGTLAGGPLWWQDRARRDLRLKRLNSRDQRHERRARDHVSATDHQLPDHALVPHRGGRSGAAERPEFSGWAAVHDRALSPAGNGRLIGVGAVGTRSEPRRVDGPQVARPLGLRSASPYRAARSLESHGLRPHLRGSGGRLVSSAVFKTVRPG